MELSFKEKLKAFGSARLIILGFVIVVFILALIKKMHMGQLFTDSLLRVGRNGILVLALLPAVRGGCGLNFGLPLGILCGLLAMIIGIEWHVSGFLGFLFAIGLGSLFGAIVGNLYGRLLNRVEGDEMTVGTYTGFATVSLMCIFWTIAPFTNRELIWTIGGKGLRTTISLENYYLQILDHFLEFSWGDFKFPTGLILFFLFMCGLVAFFFKTKSGKSIAATGENKQFAKASGVNPQKTRLWAMMLSTMLAAIGIITYCQSFGFVQLYTAPLLMAFPIIACLLIGGAEIKKASLFHVIFGTLIFETLLTIALPVTSRFIEGDISEVARVIISNGIILYALAGMKNQNA